MTATTSAPLSTSDRGDFGRAVLAEWTKFRTVRSSLWTLLIAVAVTVGLGAVFVTFVFDMYDGPADRAGAVAVSEGWWFEGLHAGIIAVMILGVIVASAEYSTGTIHATLAAVPSRARVLAAKVISFAAMMLVAGAVQAVAAFLVAIPVLASRGVDVSVADAEAWGGIAMATLAMTGAGLFGLAAGLLVRHTAGAIGAVVAVTMVLPGLTALLPASWDDVVNALPSFAMNAMFTPNPDRLAVGPATAVFFGYVALLLAVAGVLFARRDA